MTSTQPWTPPAPTGPDRAGNPQATAGFVLGLIGLAAGWVPILGLVVTVPALLLSRAGRARFRTGRAATAGRSGAGLVLGMIGTVLCVVMSVVGIVSAAGAPAPVVVPAAAPVVAPVVAQPAPVLLAVPNVVGMTDAQARQALTAAGFTVVTLGPSTGSVAGVAAGTVTTQLPPAGARASATDPIVLGEADAPPVAVIAPAPAAVAEPAAPVAPRPLVSAPQTRVAAPAAPVREATPEAPAASSAYYANCTAAKNAGAAPLHVGDPGYRKALDRDGDGVACET
ncbi:hypothetical protein GCM10009836_58990 [Pseudonocardia ailaonensis]|uniref:PASTA domain-containing protein n=1 Tax=Pseudonocardia ailaonensis TaxID=367279 RepID=A0ABN2NIH6_9PSEU